MAEQVTLEECSNGLAIITIDRPKALNAANIKMVCELREAIAKVKASEAAKDLAVGATACIKTTGKVGKITDSNGHACKVCGAWFHKDDLTLASCKAVLLIGAGEKGFCSGGDVKGLHPLLVADAKTNAPKEQVYQEYKAIFELTQLTVPTVALVHGITMGFGLGIAGAANYRIATEKSRLAMPENNIGLFPDACFTYYSANMLPKGVGRLMAVTGCHLIGAGDVIKAGLASHYMPMAKIPDMVAALKTLDFGSDAGAGLKGCIETMTEAAPDAKLLGANGDLVGALGEAKSLAEAYAALDAAAAVEGSWASQLVPAMKNGSPFTRAAVWKLLELAEADSAAGLAEPTRLAVALERDFAAACRILYRPDFVEGVRAVLVDKDNAPKWSPASPADVAEADIAAAVAPLPDGERRLGLPVA